MKWGEIASQGLWKSNPALVQLLGMCPLIAVSTDVVSAVFLGLATTVVMSLTGGVTSLLKFWVPQDMRIPVHIMIVATTTTIIDLLWSAFFPALYQSLGMFVPLIVTNCIVLGRVEAFSSRHSFLYSVWDGMMMGLGGTSALFFLGSIREVLGEGSWARGLDLLIPGYEGGWRVLPDSYPGFSMMLMPAGAFLALAFLVLLKNSWDRCLAEKKKSRE